MKFFLDEDLSPIIARVARGLDLDVTSAQELKRFALPDEEQLRFAAADDRCLVTQNYGDFDDATDRLQEARLPHAGVLLLAGSLKPNDFAGVARALARYAAQHPEGMPPYMIDFLHPAAG